MTAPNQPQTPSETPLIQELRKRYTQPVPPPCPVCNGPRDSISASGRGRVTFCCSSEDAQPLGKGDRFDECMEHFSKSRWEVPMGDSSVIELCNQFATLERQVSDLRAKLEAAEEDTKIVDWLETQVVEVRTPLVYGSHHLFFANPEEDEGDEKPSDLRDKVRAALATKEEAKV